jgi:glutamyl-Q tRNA(Asp) synthetase
LVLAGDGEKLSKQNGAPALDLAQPLQALRAAGLMLNLQVCAVQTSDWLAQAVAAWATAYHCSG